MGFLRSKNQPKSHRKKRRMAIAAPTASARALAHYGEAVRYSQSGDAHKAQAHLGRALHYTSKSENVAPKYRFGGSDKSETIRTANAVTSLLYRRVPITSYDNGEGEGKGYFRGVNGPWALYFKKQTARPGSRFGEIKATRLLEEAINVRNTHNSEQRGGQSILYCAYRFLSTLPSSSGTDFEASLDCILNVPGIDLSIQNEANAHGDIDMALSGLVADHSSLVFILDTIGKFCKLSNEADEAVHAADCNIFSLLHHRISTGW
jgi:hypothetical protein